MAQQDPVRELLDLVAVHGFYVNTLVAKLGHDIPLPREASHPDKDKATHSIEILRKWLAVLDMAVQPIVVRDAVKEQSLPRETSEALLRYLISKSSPAEADRDKTDCIATFLFRQSELSQRPIPDTTDRWHFISQIIDEYEKFIFHVLGDGTFPEIRPEHANLLREFEHIHLEVDDFRTFDQLMDSGMVQRVRDIKQSFAVSFYHPKVLANVAVYNAVFGKRFDDLFRATTVQLKSFAAKVQEDGASILSKLDGDVTVKHLADVQEEHVMTQEYGKAQENFRKVAKFKKAMDKTKGARTAAGGPPPPPPPQFAPKPVPGFSTPAAAAAAAVPPQHSFNATSVTAAPSHVVAAATSVPTESFADAMPKAAVNSVEEGKLRGQLDSIRSFVRAADAKTLAVVPLVKGVVNITPAEAEALRAEFHGEKSFRADYANNMSLMVAMVARLIVEQEEFRNKKSSSYLWKPHADAITYIINASNEIFALANSMVDTCEKRGLADKAAASKATILKLRMELQKSASLLQTAGSA